MKADNSDWQGHVILGVYVDSEEWPPCPARSVCCRRCLPGKHHVWRWLMFSALLSFHFSNQFASMNVPWLLPDVCTQPHTPFLLLPRNVLHMLHISMMQKTLGHLWETSQGFVLTTALSFISTATLPSACWPAIGTSRNAARQTGHAFATSFTSTMRTTASLTCWRTQPSTPTWAQWWRTTKAASSFA